MTLLENTVLRLLAQRGAMSSAEIQVETRASQATTSRVLASLSDNIIVMGAGKLSRYAAAHSIGSSASQQPIWLISQEGIPVRIGVLSNLARSQIHIAGDKVNQIHESRPEHILPWYLSGLRAQGFLGRILAKRLESHGVPANPEVWGAEAALIAALHTHDAPGALLIGAESRPAPTTIVPTVNAGTVLDNLAQDVARTLPTGSSAAGEQPKFPAFDENGNAFLVKFSPPRGTPFGDRWNDLLRAEAISSDALHRAGLLVARNKIIQAPKRTFLLSPRFDRVDELGRKHVVSMGAVHQAFSKLAYVSWPSTCDMLVGQRRLPKADAERAHAIFQFGRLIGNTDMHSGNAGLFVHGENLKEIVAGNFSLAPVYDMLPMRWKPDPMVGTQDYEPFDVDLTYADVATRLAAQDFWRSLAAEGGVSHSLQQVAQLMASKMTPKNTRT